MRPTSAGSTPCERRVGCEPEPKRVAASGGEAGAGRGGTADEVQAQDAQ